MNKFFLLPLFITCHQQFKDYLRIMKISILLLFTGIFQLMATNITEAQNVVINISNKTISVETLIQEIEKQTDYLIVYSKREVDTKRKITVDARTCKVSDLLTEAFANTGVQYEFERNYIVLSKQNGFTTKNMSQEKGRIVSGVVKDETGEPVIGANVIEKGTTNGVITNSEGKFTLTISGNTLLQVSYIGYINQEINIKDRTTVSIVIKEDTQALDEIVIVGFGTQKKINLTGAVGVLSGNDIQERPVSNATQALQGLIPGLNIDVNNGSLDKTPSINIRGIATIGEGSSGEPLILIDGMEGELSSVNPQDIASISVLKDVAASSIYGSRAPFGVILVTTKSGGTDGKTTINYNNSFRMGNPINKKHMMNSVQFATWINDALTNRGGSIRFDEPYMKRLITWRDAKPHQPGQRITEDGSIVYSLEALPTGQWYGGFSTGADDIDYYDVVYKDWTFSQEHNVSANGGNNKFNYYASGSFMDQNGLIKMGEEGFQRFTATAKINSTFTEWLKFNVNVRFIREDYKKPSALTDYMYEYLASKAWPTLPLYDRNGHYYYSDNTQVAALEEGGSDKKQTDYIYFQTGFVVEPVKNWITSIDLNYRVKSVEQHKDNQILMNHDINGIPYPRTTSSNVYKNFNKENYYNFNVRTEYSFTLNDNHNIHVMTGFQAENLKQDLFGLQRDGIMVASKPEVDLTNGLDMNGKSITPSVNGERKEWATAGFFGRVNYDYKGKYLLEVNLRADGSSRFRKGNQWKTFPSMSVGWNMMEESFFESLKKSVNMLKLRASYGTLGNQNTKDWYYTFQTLSIESSTGNWLQNGQKTNTAKAPGLVSETLTWETIESYNVALDWGLLNNRLSGSFDYFVRNTNNMIGAAPALPELLGTVVPKINNTDLRTQGWELSLTWRDVLKNNFSYSAKLLLSDSRTKILRYPNNPTGSIDSKTYIEGYYMNEIWGYETLGLARTDEEMNKHLETLPNGGQNALGTNWKAGDIMYKDLNGDGKISGGSETLSNLGDKKVIGNSTPRYRFGLDMNMAWKGFDMRIFFQGVLKRDYWQGSEYMFGFTSSGLWNAAGMRTVGDYFRNENTWSVIEGYSQSNLNAYLPRPMESGKNVNAQTRYLQNAAYIRLKNLQIGYTLPASFLTKAGINKIRIYVSGENLWTGTSLVKQFDPETIETMKGNGYPLSMTLSGGLSLTL